MYSEYPKGQQEASDRDDGAGVGERLTWGHRRHEHPHEALNFSTCLDSVVSEDPGPVTAWI